MRSLLLLFSGMLHVSGLALLLLIPLPSAILVPVIFAWLCMCARDWSNQLRAYRRVAVIRIRSCGSIETIDRRGQTETVRLLAGSMVLPRVAWLRLEFADRSRFGELMSGDGHLCPRWHWLQLTSRQLGARFGQAD